MKKIDISNSLIFGRKVEDIKNSLEYLDQEGYFSNSKDFSEYKEADLNIVRVCNIANFAFNPYTFVHDGFRYSFSYFIPKSEVVFVEEEPKKKELRPFKSLEEFFTTTGFKVGDIVQIKRFGGLIYETAMLTCIRVSEEYHRIDVVFGASSHPLNELFKCYKYYKNGEWLPFGVEE